jgi:outer membrane protein OmpA-like peptidoglycan-associated protein
MEKYRVTTVTAQKATKLYPPCRSLADFPANARRTVMSASLKSLKVKLACGVISAGFALCAGTGFALATEQPTAEQIIKALKPVGKITRSLTVSPVDAARKAEETRFVDTLRNKTTRSLTITEREKIAEIVQKKPSIDLEINFDFNSDTIGAKAAPQVTALGQALASPDLKGGTFVVAGYTDAKGGDIFNQTLSERRADAVKRYLAEKYRIDVANLVTVGYGKARLKDPANPLAAENRRVQVVNMAE